MNQIKARLAMNLRLAREQKSMSRPEVAELMGCHKNTIYMYEHGERELPSDQLEKLAGILKDGDWLWFYREHPVQYVPAGFKPRRGAVLVEQDRGPQAIAVDHPQSLRAEYIDRKLGPTPAMTPREHPQLAGILTPEQELALAKLQQLLESQEIKGILGQRKASDQNGNDVTKSSTLRKLEYILEARKEAAAGQQAQVRKRAI